MTLLLEQPQSTTDPFPVLNQRRRRIVAVDVTRMKQVSKVNSPYEIIDSSSTSYVPGKNSKGVCLLGHTRARMLRDYVSACIHAAQLEMVDLNTFSVGPPENKWPAQLVDDQSEEVVITQHRVSRDCVKSRAVEAETLEWDDKGIKIRESVADFLGIGNADS